MARRARAYAGARRRSVHGWSLSSSTHSLRGLRMAHHEPAVFIAPCAHRTETRALQELQKILPRVLVAAFGMNPLARRKTALTAAPSDGDALPGLQMHFH